MAVETTVILANGDFPSRPQSLELLQGGYRVVCCDGAIAEILQRRLPLPQVVIGDLDSIPDAQRHHPGVEIIHEAEQESNDLAKAFRLCCSRGWNQQVIILGATGRRDDHTLGNISLLFDFALQAQSLELWTDWGRFRALPQSGELPCQPGEQVSIFTTDSAQPLTSRGLVYPLHKLRLTRWWNATLNEAMGSSFVLQFPTGSPPVIVYSPWPEVNGKHPEKTACAALDTAPAECPFPWKKIHFTGVGGVGMSGLAALAMDFKAQVSGTDAASSTFFRRLVNRGAALQIGHNAQALPKDTQLLVYSSAVPPENPERVAARNAAIPQCRRGEFLARISRHFQRCVAIAGSHGKTTVTAMLAHIFRQLGDNPGFMIGGAVHGWDCNATAGDGRILITEVDESDRTQELMLPDLTLILNVDDDHSWAIGGAQALEDCFQRLSRNSFHTITWDNPQLRHMLQDVESCHFLPESAAENAVAPANAPGNHNRHNAAIAIAAAMHLGISREEAQQALLSFPGVARRMDLRWQSLDGKQVLLDDYAHHPTELEATLATLQELYPTHRHVVYFQPHRPERILRYGQAFAKVLQQYAHHVTILAPFMAWEVDAPEASPQSIVDTINSITPGKATLHSGEATALCPAIAALLQDSTQPTVVAVIGAGDIVSITQNIHFNTPEK